MSSSGERLYFNSLPPPPEIGLLSSSPPGILRLRLAYARAHFADGFREAGEGCAGDHVVGEVGLGDFGDGRDLADVAGGEPVSGGDVQAVLRGERGGLAQSFKLCGGARASFGGYGARAERRLGVCGRAQLDLLRASVVRGLYLSRVWVYEDADEDAAVAQSVNRSADCVEVGGRVQAAFCRYLVRLFGDERDCVGTRVGGYLNHLVGRGQLDVEVSSQHAAKVVDVLVLYLAAVAAQGNRDAVRARLLAHQGGRHHTRLRRAPRLSDGRHVVDVYVESCCHSFNACALVFKFSAPRVRVKRRFRGGRRHRLSACGL